LKIYQNVPYLARFGTQEGPALYPGIICTKFGWNWPIGSWEEVV